MSVYWNECRYIWADVVISNWCCYFEQVTRGKWHDANKYDSCQPRYNRVLIERLFSAYMVNGQRVPGQISSSSATPLNRDHFRKETVAKYRVTRLTWRHKRKLKRNPQNVKCILLKNDGNPISKASGEYFWVRSYKIFPLLGVAKTFSIKVTGHELLLHAWKTDDDGAQQHVRVIGCTPGSNSGGRLLG